jgi:hypothetical protein
MQLRNTTTYLKPEPTSTCGGNLHPLLRGIDVPVLLQCSIPSNYLRSHLCSMLKSACCHWYNWLVALQPLSRLFEMLETCLTSFNKMKK